MNSLQSFGKSSTERVENAVEKLQQGYGILLVDDENRENEGDIIFSAEKMSVKDMALMIRECSGIVCLCLTEAKCKSLGLKQMVENNTSNACNSLCAVVKSFWSAASITNTMTCTPLQ